MSTWLKASAIFLGYTAGLILAFAMFTATAHCQVSLLFTPQTMSVEKDIFGPGANKIGRWTLRACNEYTVFKSVPEERIYMAAPALRSLNFNTVSLVLQKSVNSRPLPRIVKGLQYAALGTLALGAVGTAGVTLSANAVRYVAAGAGVAMVVHDDLAKNIPDFSALVADSLNGALGLPAGACATKIVYAGKMKDPQQIQATLILNQ
jgi:hypothetical protein